MSKKLRILAAGDLHGDLGIAKKLSAKAKKNKVDLVVLAGDVYGYVKGDGKILDPFLDAKQEKKIDDFIKFVGKKAKIVTVDPVNEQNSFVGRIDEVRGDDIVLSTEKDDITINFNNIKRSNLEVEF